MPDNGGSRLNAAQLERKLRAAVGLAGGEVLKHYGDLGGLVCLESDRPEWRASASEFFESGFSFQGAGGAGNVSVVGLQNPVNSGWLAIGTRWWAETDPATPINGRAIELAWTTAVIASRGRVNRDARIGTGGPTNAGVELVSQNTTTVAALAPLITINLFKPDVESYKEPIIVPPGFAVIMIGVDNTGTRRTNIALEGGVDWYMRPFEGTWEIK